MDKSTRQYNIKKQIVQAEQVFADRGLSFETKTTSSFDGVAGYVKGISVEWNAFRGGIMIGHKSSAQDKQHIKELLEQLDIEVKHNTIGLLYFTDQLSDLEDALDILLQADLQLEVARSDKRGVVEFNRDSIFLKVAKVVAMAVDEGMPDLLARGAGVFDRIDDIITIGESVSRTSNNSYREHIVPCDFLLKEAVEMYKAGSSLAQIAIMLQQNMFIVLITPEEARKLDVELQLKTTMPEGWKLGDSVFARLDAANIKLK